MLGFKIQTINYLCKRVYDLDINLYVCNYVNLGTASLEPIINLCRVPLMNYCSFFHSILVHIASKRNTWWTPSSIVNRAPFYLQARQIEFLLPHLHSICPSVVEGNLMHHSSSVLDRSPYWHSASSLIVAGLLNRRSVPALVFGNAITSRIDCALHRITIKRSNPSSNRARRKEVKVIVRSLWDLERTEGRRVP